MDIINKIKGFDLNLLAVFVAIDEQRHVTKAARTLGITQPALSHALNRLRLLLEDQLFVKSSLGMVPTPRAEQLSAPIRSMLTAFDQDVLRTKQNFDPKTLIRTFRIYTTDLIECLLLPELLQTLEVDAPQVQVICRPAKFFLPSEDMERGVCDVAIAGFFGDLPDGFYQQKLFTDHFQTAVRSNHPRLGKHTKLSLAEYCRERHILVAPGGDLRGKVDDLLKKRKLERQISAGLHAFMSSAWVVAKSDCILTAPSQVMKQIAEGFPINVMPAPIEVPDITIVQTWHERNNQDPGHKWFREQIRKVLQKSP